MEVAVDEFHLTKVSKTLTSTPCSLTEEARTFTAAGSPPKVNNSLRVNQLQQQLQVAPVQPPRPLRPHLTLGLLVMLMLSYFCKIF